MLLPKPVLHASHHKCGTLWFHNIFESLSADFGWSYARGAPARFEPRSDLFLSEDSNLLLTPTDDFAGTHIRRDPRDAIVSGYFYHLWCTEEWCLEPHPELGGKSLQETLHRVTKEEGIDIEMLHIFHPTIRTMRDWPMGDERFLEIRYESLIADEQSNFTSIFRHYGLDGDVLERALAIAKSCSFGSMSGRRLGREDQVSHLRLGTPGDWRNHFTANNVGLFKWLFPDVLQVLGYERNDNWFAASRARLLVTGFGKNARRRLAALTRVR